MRTYSEITKLKTFEERFEYLKLTGKVGETTFGRERYLNQQLYKSLKWIAVRDIVIVRDNGCDLGILGNDIYSNIIIHHMNPISRDDIIHNNEYIFDPELLICVTHTTHNAIHYGDKSLLPKHIERKPNDTCPWR